MCIRDRSNTAKTQRRKEARGNGNKPLVDYKKLTNVSKWRTEKETNGYLIKVPKEREDAAFYLHDGLSNGKVYNFMKTPAGFFPNWAGKMRDDYFTKVIKKYR
jgi:hypothetical protein